MAHTDLVAGFQQIGKVCSNVQLRHCHATPHTLIQQFHVYNFDFPGRSRFQVFQKNIGNYTPVLKNAVKGQPADTV